LAFSNFGTESQDPGVDLLASDTVSVPPINVIPPNRPHAYYRFSPYWHDCRVDARTGDFLPGTYATTYNDLHFVPSGSAAVGRYALPNPASAGYVFQIVTFDRPTLMGTATPNYGQAGGGVEVLFANGGKQGRGLSFMINAG
jgi:hypothetical protein